MKSFFSLLLLSLSLNVFAANEIKIENARVRLTPPNSPATAIFMNITNHSSKDLKLIAVKGDFAETFELHTMEMGEGKMVMRKLDSISIKQHATVELKSGGFHIMVFKVKKPLQEGASYKVDLVFDDKTTISSNVKVEKF